MKFQQPRQTTGRYATKRGSTRPFLIILALFGIAMGYGAYLNFTNKPVTYIAPAIVRVDKSDEMLAKKIEKMKDTVVNDLATKCETKGVKDPDGAIIFDSNNEASVGAFQFQRKTVIHYVKKFEGRDITNREAIAIAIDHEKAFELAKKIIFTEATKLGNHVGVDNWQNCALKLSLYDRVGMIKQIETI